MKFFSSLPSPLVFTILIISFVISCNQTNQKNNTDYKTEIEEWHQQRIESLKEEDSWLSLAGLYQLKEGTQSFGADSTNDIIFPPKAPAHIGSIVKSEDKFTVDVQSGIDVYHDSVNVSEMELTSSEKGEPTVLTHNSLLWYIIERRGDYYIRLKDTEHPNFDSFDGIDRFPVTRKWRAKAIFNRFDSPKVITIPDILGKQYQDSLYGTLEFTIDQQQYRIAPLGHPDKDEEFFVIFGDRTNGNSTYSGGRYIYIPTPSKDGTTYIDFNKAYNPPCVFTNFATCPLPPPQNKLDIKVTAGEKMYGDPH